MKYQADIAERSAINYHPPISGNSALADLPANEPVADNSFRYNDIPGLRDFLTKLGMPAGKESFLVFKNNKYINIRTEDIAYFFVKYDSTILVTFNNQEFFINHSLEQLQQLLPEKRFYRLNRQYLVSFDSIREVEHYFARKLLVNPIIPIKEKLLVSKEKVTSFLHWMDNR